MLPSLNAQTSSKEFLEKEELLVWDGDDDANESDFFWGEVIFWECSSMLECDLFESFFLVFIHDIRDVLDSEKYIISIRFMITSQCLKYLYLTSGNEYLHLLYIPLEVLFQWSPMPKISSGSSGAASIFESNRAIDDNDSEIHKRYILIIKPNYDFM